MLPSLDPRQFLSEKLFLGKLLPKPKLYSKFELASFNGVPASVAARLAGVRAVSSFFILPRCVFVT